jgi:hypothetical protein
LSTTAPERKKTPLTLAAGAVLSMVRDRKNSVHGS